MAFIRAEQSRMRAHHRHQTAPPSLLLATYKTETQLQYLQYKTQLHAALGNRLWEETPCKDRLCISTGDILTMDECKPWDPKAL